MRKTALLTGVAGLFLMTAPAIAQDGTAPQQDPSAPPASAQPRSLELQPGSPVVGSDGLPLGVLEGVRNGPSGQELTVRGSDGVLRGVPTSGGLEPQANGVKVGWTASQFSAAPAIAAAPEPSAPPAPEPMPEPAPTPAPSEPTSPPEASPPTTAPEPRTAGEPTPSPEPAPGEGQSPLGA